MATYTVKLSPPKGHVVPSLLADVAAFVGTQKHGALGWFDALSAERIPKEWEPRNAERLAKDGFVFLHLPDGSLVAHLRTGGATPPAIVLLGSDGDSRTVANSLEEFLVLWSKGETGIDELDDDDAKGRGALATWITSKKILPPKTNEFDFQAWLDGQPAAKAPAPAPAKAKREPTADGKKLGPKMRELVNVIGRRADDPEVIAYVTKGLGKKVPASCGYEGINVVAPKAGLELLFTHRINNEKYPPIAKTARAFVPYLKHVWIREKFPEKILGVDTKTDPAAAQKALGKPDGHRVQFTTDKKPTVAYWKRTLDASADVVLDISIQKNVGITLSVDSARELDPLKSAAGHLFLAWAALRGLLDEKRFAAHSDLLAKVKQRKALGSELAKAAIPRGLWDIHLRDDEDLRLHAFRWFHNMNDIYIDDDLTKVFGKRKGEHGDEPKLDDDAWANVDKASKAFDGRFKAFLAKK